MPVNPFNILHFEQQCQIVHDHIQPYICSNTHPTSNIPSGCDEKENARVSCLFVIHIGRSQHNMGLLRRRGVKYY